ncbi:MAG TPA: hypothetical protein VGQ54_02075, partial [Burkholderiales bacterium]|nr:hypothetical protein [Burkholderiales bacterium]
TDAIIIATPRGLLPELNDKVFRQALLGDELRRVGLASVEDLRLRQVGDRRSLLPIFDLLSKRTNSDFFPVLSLEAPRERFIGSQPLGLIGVATADLPLREILGHIAPAKVGRFVPNPGYIPSLLAEQGPIVAAGLAAVAPDTAKNNVEQVIADRRAVVAACADESGDSQKIDVLQDLVGRTVPYLDAEQLKAVWIDPQWITCATPTEAVSAMLGVISSLAARDFARVGPRAVALLQDHRRALSDPARDWLVRLCMLAAIAEGHYAEVATLDDTLGVDLTSFGWNRMQRSYLRAYAEAQPASTRLR